ncbi:unnamed protein product [Linum tenue]|uniref:Uncharacterized protein n=1 Tax=Linum tenue TaxID=586396 RepID=A0AAV0PME9_9ROSI|nr:unnamed protein product [Linum tenue]
MTRHCKNTFLAETKFIFSLFQQFKKLWIIQVIQLHNKPSCFPTFGCSHGKLPFLHIVGRQFPSIFVFFVELRNAFQPLPSSGSHHQETPLQFSCEKLEHHQASEAFILVKHGG